MVLEQIPLDSTVLMHMLVYTVYKSAKKCIIELIGYCKPPVSENSLRRILLVWPYTLQMSITNLPSSEQHGFRFLREGNQCHEKAGLWLPGGGVKVRWVQWSGAVGHLRMLSVPVKTLTLHLLLSLRRSLTGQTAEAAEHCWKGNSHVLKIFLLSNEQPMKPNCLNYNLKIC